MSQYKIGSVSVTNNNNVVTGSGTLWLANISTGDLFTKAGDNVAYTVASVPSDTQITLTGNYGGATSSGSSYGITIEFTPEGYPLLSDGDLNTASIYNEALRLISNDKSLLGTAALIDVESGSFTPVFQDSYGVSITLGSPILVSNYRVFNDVVTMKLSIDLDDSGTSVSVGDVILIEPIPSIIRPISSSDGGGSMIMRKSLTGSQFASFETLISTGGNVWLCCTSVSNAVDYGDVLTGTIEWIIT